jgi:hypothetical protein
MRLAFALVLAALFTLPSTAKDKVDRTQRNGTAISPECTIVLALNERVSHRLLNKGEAYDCGYCFGMVTGIYQNISGSEFCPGDNVPMPHVLELVVRFVKNHPELSQKDDADIASRSVYPRRSGVLGSNTENKTLPVTCYNCRKELQ